MRSAYTIFKHHRLGDPCVTAGDRACVIGTQDGLFPDMGHAIPGEMGGLWAGDLKLCDGFFLAIDDVPLRSCDAFEASPQSCTFHYRMQGEGLHVVRSQFVPDGVAGCVIDLLVENLRPAPRMAEISFTVRTDILPAYSEEQDREVGRDVCEYDERTLAFYARDTRNPWHVCWGADRDVPVLLWDMPDEIYGFGNTRGRGINGRLFYRLRLAAGGQAKLRLYVAGGRIARSQAEDLIDDLRANAGELFGKKRARLSVMEACASAALPDADIERAWNWACMNLEWLMRAVPGGTRAVCENLPEAPGFFMGDSEASLSAMLPLGGVETLEAALRLLRDVSQEADGPAGRVVGGIAPDGRVASPGDALQSARFVSLVWRTFEWTGHVDFLADMMPFLAQCMHYIRRETRNFEDAALVYRKTVRRIAMQYAAMLEALCYQGAEEWRALAAGIEAPEEAALAPDAPLSKQALWHGARGHVEQMLGCVRRIASTLTEGMPGALVDEDAGPGVFVQAKAPAGIVWPMTRYLFGIHPQSPRRLILWEPHTPIGWDGWALKDLRIGDATFDVSSRRLSQGKAEYTLRASEPGWRVAVVQDGEEKTYELPGELTLVLAD